MKGKRQRINKIILCAAAITAVFLVAFLTACSGEITSLGLKETALTVNLNESVDLADYVVKEGRGKVMYSAENADIIELKGSVVKGLKEGNAAVMIMGGDFTARIAITVKDGRTVKLSFPDVTAFYSGNKYNITPEGSFPEGTEIRYFCGGVAFTGATEAGRYEITAEVKVPDGYNLICDDFNAVLTINKAHYDMSGVSFSNRTFAYDGTEKTVTISGVLPEGIAVTYKNNRGTEAGTYRATAEFSGENINYEKIGAMTSVLTIEPAVVALSDKGAGSFEKTYDGEDFVAEVTDLPEGASAQYFVRTEKENGGTEIKPCNEPLVFADAGEYVWYVKITAEKKTYENYRFTTENEIVELKENADGKYISDYIPISVKIKKAALSEGKFVLRKGEEIVTDAIYGEEITIGEESEGYSLKVEGDLPLGAKNEFDGRVTVNYKISGNEDFESVKNQFGNLDSGLYIVTATYGMPENYDKNYIALSEITFNLRINKATYDCSGMTFGTAETEAEYDGTVRVIEVEGYDPEEISVRYVIRKNGITESEILHAGKYAVTAKFTIIQDAANYNSISDRTVNFTVNPKKIAINEVTFAGAETVYDGQPVEVAVVAKNGLPDKVTVEYPKGNAFTNAGVYDAVAKFRFGDGEEDEGDYSFVINGTKVSSLGARVTIKKADFTSDNVGSIKPESGLTYFFGMKLSDVGFVSNENGFIAWENPDLLIGEMTPTGEVTDGIYFAYAVYNEDKRNYNDYRARVAITLKKAEIDLTGTAINDQFVARNASPVVAFGTRDYSDETKTLVEWTGSNLATVTLTGEKSGNYIIKGNTVFENVKLYLYDPTEYTYKAGSTLMTAYKGAATIISLPYGTTETSSRIFDSSSRTVAPVTQITVPETVVLLPENTFYGATYLEKLIFESVACTPDYFQKLFGAAKPDGVKVTVKTDKEIAAKKFYGADCVGEIEYLSPVSRIGAEAFGGCTSLKKFVYDCSELETVGDYAFNGCIALESLTLPSMTDGEGNPVALSYYFDVFTQMSKYSLAAVSIATDKPYELADYAFAYMASIKRINLSPSLAAIGKYAFRDVTADIDLSDCPITELGTYALAGYAGAKVRLPSNLAKIGAYAFKDAANLAEVSIPAGVNAMGREAFSGCKAEIEFLGYSLGEIGERAFYGYAGTTVNLPSSVAVIGKEAFASSSIEKISLVGITEICESAFRDCVNMTEFTVNAETAKLGSYAFAGCYKLTSITFEGLNPPTAANRVFDTGGAVITMYVKTNETAFRNYFEDCKAGGHYIISIIR